METLPRSSNEIASDIANNKRNLRSLTKQLKAANANLVQTKNNLQTNTEQLNTKIAEARKDALTHFSQSQIEPINEKLRVIDTRIEELNNTHKSNLDELTEEKVMQNHEDKYAMHDEITKSLNECEKKLELSMGKRFKTEFIKQMDRSKIVVEPEEIDNFIDYFNNLNAKLDTYNNSLVHNLIEKIETKLPQLRETRLLENRNNVLILSALICLSIYFLRFYILPVYGVILFMLMVYHLHNSYHVYEILLAFKAVKDNLQLIEDEIKKNILEELESLVLQENDAYKQKYDSLMKKRNELDAKKAETNQEIIKNFEFDDSEIRASFEATATSYKNQINILEAEITNIETQIDNIKVKSKELSNEYANTIQSIPEQYLRPVIGESYIFTTRNDINSFFFGLQEDNNEPIFFTHPMGSSIILYDESTDIVFRFLQLINVQLRNKLNPAAFQVEVYDQVTRGMALSMFLVPGIDSAFSIKATSEEISNSVEQIGTLINRRNTLLLNGEGNIEAYNEARAAEKSLTEPYKFIFNINAPENILLSQTLIQAYHLGNKLGIYYHNFMEKETFYNYSDAAKLINCIDAIYILEENSIMKRTKDFALENLIKPTQKK